MKISYHLYKLRPVGSWNSNQRPHSCEGALLKVEYPDGRTGYADLHPWPTLGDRWLAEQLDFLKNGQMTFQIEQAIWMANRDSISRKNQSSALKDLPLVENHFFLAEGLDATKAIFEEALAQGYKTIKMKVGNDRNKEANFLNVYGSQLNFKWRLDFNAKLDIFQFLDFWNRLKPEVKNKIEYIEDPLPYKLADWTEIAKTVPLAIDREISKVNWEESNLPFSYIVIKPAVQDPDKFVRLCKTHNLKLIIGSYLDHPVGQIHANWIAAELKQQEPNLITECGLMSQRAYSYSDFISLIEASENKIKSVYGTGIGFDILWDRLEWKLLKP